MESTIFGANWPQFQSKVLDQWPKLRQERFVQIKGDREKLISAIQEDYNIPREAAEKQVLEWEKMQKL